VLCVWLEPMVATTDRVRRACLRKKNLKVVGFEPKTVLACEFSLIPTTPCRTSGSRLIVCGKHATCMQLLKVLEVTTSTWTPNVFILAICRAAYRSDTNRKQGPPRCSWHHKMFFKWPKTFNQPIGAKDLSISLDPHLIWTLRGCWCIFAWTGFSCNAK
jgi:hypothetical protein